MLILVGLVLLWGFQIITGNILGGSSEVLTNDLTSEFPKGINTIEFRQREWSYLEESEEKSCVECLGKQRSFVIFSWNDSAIHTGCLSDEEAGKQECVLVEGVVCTGLYGTHTCSEAVERKLTRLYHRDCGLHADKTILEPMDEFGNFLEDRVRCKLESGEKSPREQHVDFMLSTPQTLRDCWDCIATDKIFVVGRERWNPQCLSLDVLRELEWNITLTRLGCDQLGCMTLAEELSSETIQCVLENEELEKFLDQVLLKHQLPKNRVTRLVEAQRRLQTMVLETSSVLAWTRELLRDLLSI